MNNNQHGKCRALRKHRFVGLFDVGDPHRQIRSAEEIPHETGAVFQIRDRVPRDCTRPGLRDRGRAEQLFFRFDLVHDKFARFEPPIEIPFGRPIAAVQQQGRVALVPGDGKLVFLGEVADAAEVKDHDRLQWMLPCRSEHTVIDELHKTKEDGNRRDEKNGRALPSHLQRPGDVDGKQWCGDNRVRPKQNAKTAEREGEDLDRDAHSRRTIRDGESQHDREQPGDREQHVAPQHADENKGRWQQRQNWRQRAQPGGATRKRKAKHAKGQPIGRRYQQEHAGRARRDRIDQSPEHRHHRRLPVAQSVFCDVLVNELGIVSHDAGVKDQQRQPESRGGQAGGHEPATLCLL